MAMETLACPICSMTDILAGDGGAVECATCGHEWDPDGGGLGEIRDANGVVLANGDDVILIKNLPLKGTESLKIGTKVRGIRLISGDHEIDCKINGRGVLLKAQFVKKV